MSEPIISLRGVSKAFGDLVVLDDVDLDIPAGQTTAIIGPSGTGKSVLLKHIVGLLHPDAGHVFVEGVDVTTVSEAELYEVRKSMGMLFQNGALFDAMSTGDNIALPLRHHTSLSEAEIRARVEEVLEMVELPGLYDRPTSALSGGQRKRVGLARAIVLQPEIVLFDEPNSGLDPLTSDTIDRLIVRMKETLGVTFLVITHDIVSAAHIADHIAMLHRGKVEAFAPTAEFLRSTSPVVRRFLQRNLDLDATTAGGAPRLPHLD